MDMVNDSFNCSLAFSLTMKMYICSGNTFNSLSAPVSLALGADQVLSVKEELHP